MTVVLQGHSRASCRVYGGRSPLFFSVMKLGDGYVSGRAGLYRPSWQQDHWPLPWLEPGGS